MGKIIGKIVDAAFELGYRLSDSRYKIEKITVSISALRAISGDRIRIRVPEVEFGVGRARVCDIPLELDDKQVEDFKFVITISNQKVWKDK